MEKIELTQPQIEFIADTFFKIDGYAGWKSIALKLLVSGECVVSGNDPIWVGYVGNFIETSKDDKFVGCLNYKFNLEGFLASSFFIKKSVDCFDKFLDETKKKKVELDKDIDKLEDVSSLLKKCTQQ